MTQGLPPQPTIRSIVGGIGLFVLVCAAFAALPNLVKWAGAALTFIPGQLGLIDVVHGSEVMPVDMTSNPTPVSFAGAGDYLLYTSNYDLLVINDAVAAVHAKPWFRLTDEAGEEVSITLVERGLAVFDTPLASGRPVAHVVIAHPGNYVMTHPSRRDFTYFVPDTTTGREGAISVWMLVEVAILSGALLYWRRYRIAHRPASAYMPPSPESRLRYVREQQEKEIASLPKGPPTPLWKRDDSAPKPKPAASVTDVRDVLELVRVGEVTEHQAQAEIDRLVESGSASSNWGAALALTLPEQAAYSQGASVADLLSFRAGGWPRFCARCGQEIDHEDLKWWFVRDEAGVPGIRHVQCRPA
ncbi:MAG TPA: hypothetical protein VIU38_01435 [Anaerolineales bacterium]